MEKRFENGKGLALNCSMKFRFRTVKQSSSGLWNDFKFSFMSVEKERLDLNYRMIL